jgi:hypothetical protein
MKNLLCIVFFLGSISLHAQDISGFYSGKLVNDSTGKEQQYELALSEYRGKITGYSYTTFIVDDKFYYSVKRVKAQRNNGTLEVEDVKMLGNNFPQPPDKGVRQVMSIPLNEKDSITEIRGTWKTTETKKHRFYSIGGAMDMRRERDSSRLALVGHLKDLGELQQPEVQPAPQTIAAAPTPVVQQPVKKEAAPKPVAENKQPVAAPVPALAYDLRSEQLAERFITTNDSLVLHFYDNGMVDGDTISVYVNGTNIISKTKLTAAAAKQTIYLDPSVDVHKLVLVAENLGTIPPNTGLLVIQDGTQRYQVHFTADLQTNAAIEFRRKPKEK